MSSLVRRWLAAGIMRNPAYLVSAVLVAAGARLLLVGPADAAGDVALILATLAVVQAYEWAVAATMVALQRARRSTEDLPSLMLVAAAFWTGPLAATIEMVAQRPTLGACLAAGAGLIALGEMIACARVLGLRLSRAGQAVCAACIVLLVAVAPLLKTPDRATGDNELSLYAAWWVYAGVVLGCLALPRALRQHRPAADLAGFNVAARVELAFAAITLGATAAHLVGMNYAFFCHAAPFYASPALVALASVGFCAASRQDRSGRGFLTVSAALPAVALFLARSPFDERFPVDRLPPWMADPLIALSGLAALSWWHGFLCHRIALLLHAGTAALALMVFQIARGPVMHLHQIRADVWLLLLYLSVAYLLVVAWLRRSRCEALAAVYLHLVAVVLLVWERTQADLLIVCLVAGWSALVGMHVAVQRPGLAARLVPVVALAVIPWLLKSAETYEPFIALHSMLLMLVLWVAGHAWRWTRYRSMAIVLLLGHVAAFAWRWTAESGRPMAATLVLAGFAALAGGVLISWNKRSLVKHLCPDVRPDRAQAP